MIHRAPKFMRIYGNDTKNMNLIKAAIKKYNINTSEPKPTEPCAPKRVKYKIHLTKKEIRKIDSHRPSKKMGFAERMHAYEEHKMNKFIKKHPAPTERELAEDLFPEELKAGYKNMLYIRREHVRNILCETYCKTKNKELFYRAFTVLSITKDPATGKEHNPVVSEVERDDSFYLAHMNEKTPKETLHNILVNMAKDAHNADTNAIKVKIYNKYGFLVDSCKC
jgi:hypothetical protein